MEAEFAAAGVTREAVNEAVALRNAGLTVADVQETIQLRRMMTGLVDDKMGALVRELAQFRADITRALDTTNTSIRSLQKETQARDQNALARHQNALITHDEQAPLYPLHDLRTAEGYSKLPPHRTGTWRNW